jgi:hypothetical protein
MHDVPKDIWTDDDFDQMGWHDSTVHAIEFEPANDHAGSIHLDIDYIFEWVHPSEPGGAFTFWVAPATLVFPMAWDVIVRIEMLSSVLRLEITDIVRTPYAVPSGAPGFFTWTVDGDNFAVEMKADGYRQYIRRRPILTDAQSLTPVQRGGASFQERGFLGAR